MSVSRVITFGEILLRLTAPAHQRFRQAQFFTACYGGSEANAAVSLSNYGTSTAFVTRLPAHALGDAAIGVLRANGVNTDYIARGGNRIGLYFVEQGAGCRGRNIVYDRAGSSIATATTDTFVWENVFSACSAEWFHFSGITPALSDDCAAMCLAACKAAKARGMTVSCDLNYRESLWPREKAKRVMDELCRYVDVCIAYEDEPEEVFGITAPSGVDGTDAAGVLAAEMRGRFGFSVMAVTVSRSYSAMHRDWAAVLCDDSGCHVSRRYEFDAVDTIGGGDAFSGALIHALLNGMSAQQAIEFAAAAGCLKYTTEGDIALATLDEVNALIKA